MNDNSRLANMKAASEADVNESEKPSDLGFAKNCQNPTEFRFGFELHHICILSIFVIDSLFKLNDAFSIRVCFYS